VGSASDSRLAFRGAPERIRKLACGREALVGVLGQRFGHHPVELGRQRTLIDDGAGGRPGRSSSGRSMRPRREGLWPVRNWYRMTPAEKTSCAPSMEPLELLGRHVGSVPTTVPACVRSALVRRHR